MRENEIRPNKNPTSEQLELMKEATEAVFKDYTAAVIARNTGLNRSAITAARCRGRFSVDLAERIAKFLKVRPWDIRPDLKKADFVR